MRIKLNKYHLIPKDQNMIVNNKICKIFIVIHKKLIKNSRNFHLKTRITKIKEKALKNKVRNKFKIKLYKIILIVKLQNQWIKNKIYKIFLIKKGKSKAN